MNGVDIKEWNKYIEEQEMVQGLIYFIINVIIKGLQYAYLKMKIIMYLEHMLPYHGHLIKVINQQMVAFYLH